MTACGRWAFDGCLALTIHDSALARSPQTVADVTLKPEMVVHQGPIVITTDQYCLLVDVDKITTGLRTVRNRVEWPQIDLGPTQPDATQLTTLPFGIASTEAVDCADQDLPTDTQCLDRNQPDCTNEKL